jgi:hypothetical protein
LVFLQGPTLETEALDEDHDLEFYEGDVLKFSVVGGQGNWYLDTAYGMLKLKDYSIVLDANSNNMLTSWSPMVNTDFTLKVKPPS